eukprot:INCI12329.1.p1 GENE.INCI12329.1~~INCI12329.1.p1  ORF type:complete len:660 (-),score=196.69 INCI12329.1:1243-3222(-)
MANQDAATAKAAAAAAIALKKKEVAILNQGAKKALNFQTRKVIRSLKNLRKKLGESGLKDISKETTLTEIDGLVAKAADGGLEEKSKSRDKKTTKKKKKNRKKKQSAKDDSSSSSSSSSSDSDDHDESSDVSLFDLLRQYRRQLLHLELYRECNGQSIAAEYLYRKKQKGIESRRKKFLQRQQRREAAAAAKKAGNSENSEDKGTAVVPSPAKIAEQERMIAEQKKLIQKKLLASTSTSETAGEGNGEHTQPSSREIAKRDLVTELLGMKPFVESVEALAAFRQKQQFEEKLAQQRIKRRAAMAAIQATALTLDDVWVGQMVTVVPYSKLKTVCLRRQEADKAKLAGKTVAEQREAAAGENGDATDLGQQNSGVSEEERRSDEAVAGAAAAKYKMIKHAARWLGDKGRKAEHRGEITKLDPEDGTVQVKFKKMAKGARKGAPTNGASSLVVFHDWFVPEALRSLPRQRISKAESLARQKAEEIVAKGKEGALVAKGTEASDLKGRARKRAARAEIHRRQRLLEQGKAAVNRSGSNSGGSVLEKAAAVVSGGESMFLETLGAGAPVVVGGAAGGGARPQSKQQRGKRKKAGGAGDDEANDKAAARREKRTRKNASAPAAVARSAAVDDQEHPSWKAKQAQKEMLRRAVSGGGSGKKMVFD